MTPAYRITSEGKDITANFNGRLIDLTITDEANTQSDTMAITVEDSGSLLEIPRAGARLNVSLGYVGALVSMGLYVVDESAISGPPDRLIIRGAGASFLKSDQGNAMQSKRNRSWNPGTVGSLIRAVASLYNLTAEVSAKVEAIQHPHIDQVKESDLNMLLRLAGNYDLIIKPTFGKLVAVSKTDRLTVKNKPVPRFTLTKPEMSTWDFRFSNRNRFTSVVTEWHNVQTGQPIEVRVGEGNDNQTYRPPHSYADAQAAAAAANAFLRNFQRCGIEFTIRMPGRTDFVAGGLLAFIGVRSEIDSVGQWEIKRIEHSFSRGGFTTTITGTAANEQEFLDTLVQSA